MKGLDVTECEAGLLDVTERKGEVLEVTERAVRMR